MANNRMYLRCKNCGEIFFLAKTYLFGYFTSDNYYKNNLLNGLNDFLDEHKYCEKEVNDMGAEPSFEKKEYNEENSFEICYEFYDDSN